MRGWFLKLRMRLKLMLAFGSILLMSVLLTIVGIRTINRVIYYNALTERIEGFNVSTLEMSRYIQEFADRGFKREAFLKDNESPWLEAYADKNRKLRAELDTLEHHVFFSDNENRGQYDSLKVMLTAYNDHVIDLIALYAERGFQDYGVEGKLRAAIHDVEDTQFPYDRATMLMLRRHEKDFFLRKDMKYLNRFNTQATEFKHAIDTVRGADETIKQQILSEIDNYKSLFNHIVTLEQRIGLDTRGGVLGEINATYGLIESKLDTLTATIKLENEKIVKNALILLLSLLTLQIVIGFILVFFYASLLTKSIVEIKSALVKISQGSFPAQLAVRTQDEIAEAKRALNYLVDRIKAAVKFSTDLGKGNLKIDYDERYNDDVLAQAIIKMKNQLVEADERQAAINWQNEGMAKFSEILKNESEGLVKLGDDIIKQMVTYLGANQGALYILNQEKKVLERTSTYAYHKKKFVDHEVKIGQGLVGQSVLEKSYIHVTDVPANFITITSGLGESTATNILIMPLMIHEKVTGVVELASFKPFDYQMITFTQHVSENIANILSNKKTAEMAKNLLVQAQQKADELKAQEEELRQNSEELQATQEEMQRQKKELLTCINELEQQVEEKDEEMEYLKNLLSNKTALVEEPS